MTHERTGKRPRLRVIADPGFETAAKRFATRLSAPYGPGAADLVVAVGRDGPRIGASWRLDLAKPRSGAEAVVRAVRGRRPATGLWVVDATAGLGADAAALWRAGMRVTMIERDQLVAALLEDALERLRQVSPSAERRFELRVGDACGLLTGLSGPPDVVYLDPMYPRLRGGAKRRGAAWLRCWLGERSAVDDEADLRLLKTAQRVARYRVVVKRPIKAQPLAPAPSGSLRGSTTRFDLYPAQADVDGTAAGGDGQR